MTYPCLFETVPLTFFCIYELSLLLWFACLGFLHVFENRIHDVPLAKFNLTYSVEQTGSILTVITLPLHFQCWDLMYISLRQP